MVRQRSCRGSTRFASCFIHSTPSGEDAIKGSTPLELMTVGESTPDGEGGVDVVVRGSGAVMGALRLNIISTRYAIQGNTRAASRCRARKTTRESTSETTRVTST